MKKLTVGSLFAGIGGFDLGLELAGMEIKWQVEIDPFCRKVLEKHWPKVRRYEDVRQVYGYCGEYMRGPRCLELVDVVCGGFPCQPVSVAGKRRAQKDERWLWPEFSRLIRELEPRYVIVENVPGLFTAGFDQVLGDLAALGFDAEWECLPASAFGAPHIRERVWIVAYTDRERQLQPKGGEPNVRRRSSNGGQALANANGSRLQERFVFSGVPGPARCDDDGQDASVGCWWATEPNVGRVAHGVPAELDFIRRVIGHESNYSQAEPKARELVWQIVRTMWEYPIVAAASPDIYRERLRDLVPGMPQERARQGWLLGPRIEEDEELCRLLQTVYAASFQEAQDMLPGVLERIGAKKRPQALGGRVDRLRGLGNAIVPQIAEWIGKRIIEAEAERQSA